MSDCPWLELSQNGNQLLASLQPSGEHAAFDKENLLAFIAAAGYPDWALFDEALDVLLVAYNKGIACQSLAIGEQRDGKYSLEITGGAMQAWLTLSPACGGKPVNPDDVFLALGVAGITFGIDPVVISASCAANKADRVLVASFVPAVQGEDAYFELLVSDARDRSPQVNDKGLIDFRDLGEIPTVIADQPLMRRIPATTGKDGRNVRGEEIKAIPGHSAAFSEPLLGAYMDKDDPNLLRAVFSGQPVCSATGVNVEHVLHLRNVNVATGNISFDGTVNIAGEVLSGMKVSATGDIIVGEVVDGGILEAGGDIKVGGGIIAKAQVTAAGAVTVRFIENAQVHAGTTLNIEDTSLQADLQANNQILVGLKNSRGKLAGGSARAMMLIQTPVLGSPGSGLTQVVLGVNPERDAQHQELLQSLEKCKAEEDKLDKLLQHLVKQNDKSGMLERVNASRQEAVKEWGKLLTERGELEKKLALIADARVEVGDNVSGAVDITLGKKVLHLRRSFGAGIFSLQGDKIEFTDPSGNAMSEV
ncbi:MAG: FapA family protein [Betaproteobacteria bacterium]